MTRARRYLWCAALCGAVHAAFSLYWALGGRWLLDTVGQWALDWADRAPTAASLALVGIGVAKAAGAAVPLLVDADRLPWAGLWRALSLAALTAATIFACTARLASTTPPTRLSVSTESPRAWTPPRAEATKSGASSTIPRPGPRSAMRFNYKS